LAGAPLQTPLGAHSKGKETGRGKGGRGRVRGRGNLLHEVEGIDDPGDKCTLDETHRRKLVYNIAGSNKAIG